MVKFTSTQTVLAITVLTFGIMACAPLIVDRLTGGNIKNSDNLKPTYGNYNVEALFPVFALSGFYLFSVADIRTFSRDGGVGSSCSSSRSCWRPFA